MSGIPNVANISRNILMEPLVVALLNVTTSGLLEKLLTIIKKYQPSIGPE